MMQISHKCSFSYPPSGTSFGINSKPPSFKKTLHFLSSHTKLNSIIKPELIYCHKKHILLNTKNTNTSSIPRTSYLNKFCCAGTGGTGGALPNEEKSLVNNVRSMSGLSFVSFWIQLALSLVTAGIFLFEALGSKASSSSNTASNFPMILLFGSIVFSFISTGMIGYLQIQFRSILRSPQPYINLIKLNVVSWILNNLYIGMAGMMSAVLSLQAQCGLLTAKVLTSSSMNLLNPNAPTGLDVFGIQGCANILLSHVVSAFFLALILRIVQQNKRIDEKAITA